MPTNKNAIIRYQALDRCFSNFGREYKFEDLLNACNEALYEYDPSCEGIKRRQLFDDIKFMKSEQGYSARIETYYADKKPYYRYEDRKFSINNQPLNESETNQLKETLMFLHRFKGMPQFDWIDDMIVRLENTLKIDGNRKSIIGFEQNQDFTGLKYLTELFNAIFYKKPLKVKYKSYKKPKPEWIIIHPYYLKQYNSRWFLFGMNDSLKIISNMALDRVLEIKSHNGKYIENEEIDFEEYFYDVVGVSVSDKAKTEKIVLQISNDLWPYIESKPLHGSQTILKKEKDFVEVKLNVQTNYELTTLIFSYGEKVKVIEPQTLADEIKKKAQQLLKNYSNG